MASFGEFATVRCELPKVAEVRCGGQRYTLDDLRTLLGVKAPVIGVVPLPRIVEKDDEGRLASVVLEVGTQYTAILGSAPLIRFRDGAHCWPEVRKEGEWLLGVVEAPIHVIVFTGKSRCGKSTTCSRLGRHTEEEAELSNDTLDRFSVGHDGEPVTSGADVVVVPHPSGRGSVLLMDCEGSDNAMTHNSSHYRALATIAFAVASKVVHCEFGQISESTLTDLCATIAAKKMIKTTVSSDEDKWDHCSDLSLLVIAARFACNLQTMEKMLKEVPGTSRESRERNDVRRVLADEFKDFSMKSLPDLANDTYPNSMADLRTSLMGEASAVKRCGLELSGEQVADVFKRLCKELSDSEGVVEPYSIYTCVIRNHLQALAKEVRERFKQCLPPVERYREDLDDHEKDVAGALEDFDQKTREIESSEKEVCRQELAVELNGLFNALLEKNKELRSTEERAASMISLALQDSFSRQLPRLPLTRSMLTEELERFDSLVHQQVAAFDAQCARLYCSEVVRCTGKELKEKVQTMCSRVREADGARRIQVEAEIEDVLKAREKKFLNTLPQVECYVNDHVLDTVERDCIQVVHALAADLAHISEKGAWEEQKTKRRISDFTVTLETNVKQLRDRNEAFARRDSEMCVSIEEEMVAKAELIVAEAQARSSTSPEGRILSEKELEAAAFSLQALCNEYEVGTGDVACKHAVLARGKALVSTICRTTQDLRDANADLVHRVQEEVHAARDREASSFRSKFPEALQGWMSSEEMNMLDTREASLGAFDATVELIRYRGPAEKQICGDARGVLRNLLDELWKSVRDALDSQEQKDRAEAVSVASRLLTEAKSKLPPMPLEKSLEIEQLRCFDRRETWLQTYDSMTANLPCRPAVQAERSQLVERTSDMISKLFLDNEEKRRVESCVKAVHDIADKLLTSFKAEVPSLPLRTVLSPMDFSALDTVMESFMRRFSEDTKDVQCPPADGLQRLKDAMLHQVEVVRCASQEREQSLTKSLRGAADAQISALGAMGTDVWNAFSKARASFSDDAATIVGGEGACGAWETERVAAERRRVEQRVELVLQDLVAKRNRRWAFVRRCFAAVVTAFLIFILALFAHEFTQATELMWATAVRPTLIKPVRWLESIARNSPLETFVEWDEPFEARLLDAPDVHVDTLTQSADDEPAKEAGFEEFEAGAPTWASSALESAARWTQALTGARRSGQRALSSDLTTWACSLGGVSLLGVLVCVSQPGV
uniref:Guanylate-binding protein N-terminal domain-containing protein n=1 Tax=Noctiluca scintillans TaxID=2966 RepID=A0A7S1EVK6_NOCSC|mmetsp:Transcript_12583/g.34828  ORF Transcript_12583/g.34828 Transcript_12583/m.34828 type:complete len:1240 (+) Transcript_12583:96-3815(+)